MKAIIILAALSYGLALGQTGDNCKPSALNIPDVAGINPAP